VKATRFRQWATGILAGTAIAVLASCATVGVGASGAEETVKARAQKRWDALVQGDTKTAYELFSPGTRATLTLAEFVNGIRIGFWKAVKVDKVECGTPDRCEVFTTIEYDHRGMRVKTPNRETWIRDGSDWWYVRR
jgi:hypothetical protein